MTFSTSDDPDYWRTSVVPLGWRFRSVGRAAYFHPILFKFDCLDIAWPSSTAMSALGR